MLMNDQNLLAKYGDFERESEKPAQILQKSWQFQKRKSLKRNEFLWKFSKKFH